MKNVTRRKFIGASLLLGIGTFLLPKNTMSANAILSEKNSLKGKKVLYIYGGWEGHEPQESVNIFVPWLRSEGAEVIVSETLDSYLDEKLMQSLDLVIQNWSMGKITPQHEKNLLNAIRNGCGFAGWHGGIGDSFRENTEYQFMVGGQFVAHPGNIIDYVVNITDKEDEITKGLNDFSIRSEQYYLHIDPTVKVLATTTFSGEHARWIEGAIMPVVWKKRYGKGRVFYSSLGHVMKDFETPEVLEIQKRGIKWAAKK